MEEEAYFATLDEDFYIKYKGNIYPFIGGGVKDIKDVLLDVIRGNYSPYSSASSKGDELIWLTYNEFMLLGFS